MDLVIEQQPDIPVLFLDTGYHFPETYVYRDQMTDLMHLNLVNLAAKMPVAEQESRFGILNQTAPDRCCASAKWSRCSAAWPTMASGSPRCAANNRPPGRICSRWIISNCPPGINC